MDQSSTHFRDRLAIWLETFAVQSSILALIVINAAILGMETSPILVAEHGVLMHWVDAAILVVFVVEIAARIYVHRGGFFRDPWSVFDFVVVGIALIPASGPLAILRALRVLRVLRMLTMVKTLRRVVGALLAAIPGLNAIVLVLLLIYYVFAVIATHLFGPGFPEWFGNLGRSMYTLFQIMTLESWSMGIVRPLMEVYPYAWVFFVPFILIATFTMLNLFIAIIVNAMQATTEAEHAETMAAMAETRDTLEEDIHAEVLALRQELRELRAELLNLGRKGE